MRNEDLPTTKELVRIAKETFNEDFTSEADCFRDAFSNGEYHEEDFDWKAVASGLNPNQLVSLFLPVCHGLMRGSETYYEGESLETIMGLYSNLVKWQRNQLESPDEILNSLDAVRPFVLELAAGGGWVEAKSFYQMLDYGIRQRMGVMTHPLDSSYD